MADLTFEGGAALRKYRLDHRIRFSFGLDFDAGAPDSRHSVGGRLDRDLPAIT